MAMGHYWRRRGSSWPRQAWMKKAYNVELRDERYDVEAVYSDLPSPRPFSREFTPERQERRHKALSTERRGLADWRSRMDWRGIILLFWPLAIRMTLHFSDLLTVCILSLRRERRTAGTDRGKRKHALCVGWQTGTLGHRGPHERIRPTESGAIRGMDGE